MAVAEGEAKASTQNQDVKAWRRAMAVAEGEAKASTRNQDVKAWRRAGAVDGWRRW